MMNMHLEKTKDVNSDSNFYISSITECLLTGQEAAECNSPYMRNGILLKAQTAIKTEV